MPAHAATEQLQPLRPAPLQNTARVFPAPVRDAVLSAPLNGSATAAATARAASARYTTGDGISIPVDVSSAYKATPSVIQSYVTFLGSLTHGSELRSLRVYIAPPKQITSTFCGAGTLACYEGDNQTMYVPGASQQSNPPLQFLIAHEYGHHIELSRSNAPWVAFDTGTKNWFTYEQVCTRTRAGRLATGYWSDPSEGFAESYADLQYPGVPFPYNALMLPDQAAYQAIRQDVLQPWTGNHDVLLAGTLAARSGAAQTFQLATPLDGTVSFTLTPPSKADYRLQVLAGGKTIARGAKGTTTIKQLCGVRSLTVQVTRASGSGPFSLTANLP
ncbi:MAG: hypothetical protein ACXVRH_05885 [Thermoleophilaceae bacterium]